MFCHFGELPEHRLNHHKLLVAYDLFAPKISVNGAVQIALTGVQDSFSKTRGAAVFAIGQLSEQCQPETGQKAREILPAVFTLVNDPDSEVQEQAHYALQTFCESLGE